jgi:hypothetical protein
MVQCSRDTHTYVYHGEDNICKQLLHECGQSTEPYRTHEDVPRRPDVHVVHVRLLGSTDWDMLSEPDAGMFGIPPPAAALSGFSFTDASTRAFPAGRVESAVWHAGFIM